MGGFRKDDISDDSLAPQLVARWAGNDVVWFPPGHRKGQFVQLLVVDYSLLSVQPERQPVFAGPLDDRDGQTPTPRRAQLVGLDQALGH